MIRGKGTAVSSEQVNLFRMLLECFDSNFIYLLIYSQLDLFLCILFNSFGTL